MSTDSIRTDSHPCDVTVDYRVPCDRSKRHPRCIASVTLYGDEDLRTTAHLVRDALQELTGRRWTITEAVRYCVEQQGMQLLDSLVKIMDKSKS